MDSVPAPAQDLQGPDGKDKKCGNNVANKQDIPGLHSLRIATLERLDLNQVRLRIVGLNIGQIRGLVKLADDGVPRLDRLAAVQRVVLKVENYTTARGGDAAAASDAVVRVRRCPECTYPHLGLMARLGIRAPQDVLEAYSKAMDDVAGFDIAAATARGAPTGSLSPPRSGRWHWRGPAVPSAATTVNAVTLPHR
jgi:hypothetical protein